MTMTSLMNDGFVVSVKSAIVRPVRASYTRAVPLAPPAAKIRPRSTLSPTTGRPSPVTRIEPCPVRRSPFQIEPVASEPE